MTTQIIQLPYEGLQTKVDPKMAPLGTYEILDNVQQVRTPELVKREALQEIGVNTTPSNITALYNYNNELGALTTSGLFAYDPSSDRFIQKGYTASPIVTSTPVIANTYTQTCCDGSVSNTGIFGGVWVDSRGGVRCTIKNIISDTVLVPDLQLSSTGIKPKVVSNGNFLIFIWAVHSTTTVFLQQYNIISNTWGTVQTITTVLGANSAYDIVSVNNSVIISVVTTSADPGAVVCYLWAPNIAALGTGTNGYPAPITLSIAVALGSLCLNMSVDPLNGYIYLIVGNGSNDVYFTSFTPNFITKFPGTLITSGGALAHPIITLTCVPDTAFNLYIYVSTDDGSANYVTYNAQLSSANTSTPTITTAVAVFYLQLSVYSRAIWYSGHAYLVLSYNSPLQNTYFGVREDGSIWSRMLTELGGGVTAAANCITSISLVNSTVSGNSSTYIVPLLKTTVITVADTSYTLTTSVFTNKLFFSPANIDNKTIAKYLNIAGGYLKQYDGYSVFEQGFHLYPELPTLVQINTMGGGLTLLGTYSYIVCWEWVDNLGQLQRSAPSLPATVTLTSSNNTVTITVPSLPITNKRTRFNDTRTPVVMAVYRTLSTGTIYYRVNQSQAIYTYNNDLTATLSWTEGISDAVISLNGLLYTTGGVLENISIPSNNLLCVGKNRVFISGIDTEPNKCFFSKEKQEGIGVEFSAELSVIVDSLGGDITAIAAMDDKYLIFKKSVIYYISGQGPDNLGNGSFTIPMLISSDCGCNSPQSIVLMKDGIMFQSQKGIYLCDRQLNVGYIGAAIDHITTNMPGFTVTSAVNLPDRNQVYFTTNTNQALVYDTYFEKWYTHSFPFNPIGSTLDISTSNTWYVASNSFVCNAQDGVYYDLNGMSIQTHIKTNWITLNGLGGYGRIFAIFILGDNANMDSTLTANLYYDYEQFSRQTVSINPTKLSTSTWGSDTTWGSGNPWGSTTYNGTYAFLIIPQMQKCTAIKIELLDNFSDGARNQSFKFSGIALAVEIKANWNKNLPFTRRLT